MGEVVAERRRERFTEKRDVGLDQPAAVTMGDSTVGDVGMHVGVGVEFLAVNTVLGGEGAMGFDHFLDRNTSSTFKGVNVLREAPQQQTLVRDQSDERMGDGRLEFSGVELAGKGVERDRVLFEE